MVAENYTNFATSSLNGAIASTSSTSFSVTGGQGALFPSSNFLVTIDSEIILIASRATDTFTVASSGRGYNGTVAATHSNGVTVQLSATAYSFGHLWSNVADTYVPEVPPVQLGGSTSSYNNEFENQGSWTLYPTPGGGTLFNAGSSLDSHLLLYRVSPDSTTYFAYIPFAPGATFWTITAKLSEGTNFVASDSTGPQTELFVCDAANPTSGFAAGNRVKILTALQKEGVRYVRAVQSVSGTENYPTPPVVIPLGASYLRLTSNGTGTYWLFFSLDGLTYWQLANFSGAGFTVASLGLDFKGASPWAMHQAAVDYVRVIVGSGELPFGG